MVRRSIEERYCCILEVKQKERERERGREGGRERGREGGREGGRERELLSLYLCAAFLLDVVVRFGLPENTASEGRGFHSIHYHKS